MLDIYIIIIYTIDNERKVIKNELILRNILKKKYLP